MNADIFEFRKKTRVYRAQRCQNPKTMSFNMLTYSPPPPGQPQQDPMADARS